MKNWKHVALICFVLIGATASFGFWSLDQFGDVFDNLEATYLANVPLGQGMESASTSPEVSGAVAVSTIPELVFDFHQKDSRFYIGCTYLLTWQSSTTITSLETALVNAGTRELLGPIASGLAKEIPVGEEFQNFTWKVGFVWPGAYYIKISKINDFQIESRSKIFEIDKIPEGVSEEERASLCVKSSS